MVQTTSDNSTDELILVDENDVEIGFETKLSAHQNGGKLHRAFSIFIFNSAGELLLQRRASGKYHFGGMWTNTCCSHPRRGQTTADAAHFRLQEEFGFDTELRELFTFQYSAADPSSGLTENEVDHVFTGRFDGMPDPNPDEIGEWKWIRPDDLLADLRQHPERYTPWFKLALDRVLKASTKI